MDPPPDPTHSYKPGTIKSIKLVNFMCHDSFELSLGPRVNFIIGPNGSGKSALLTALVVALGGRATTTSRAKRTNEFVMYGKNWAKVVVVLHNYDKIMNKDQAFKPDDYGKFITIERIIYKDTSSKLLMKNDKDKRVSERKQELDEMIEHFGILINNPICILNQEVSKTFLHSKRPEDKFELFMKATNLEQIEQNYLAATQSHKNWDNCNNKSSYAFKRLDEEYNACKEKTGFLEGRAKLNDKLENLNVEMMYAIARDNELISEEVSKKVHNLEASIADANKVIDNRKKKIDNLEGDIQVMKASIDGINKSIDETREKFQSYRSKELNEKTKHLEIKQKIDRSTRKIARYQEDKASLEKAIVDLKKQFKDQDNLDQDNEQRKLEIERLEREIPSEQAKEKSIRLHTAQLSTSMTSTRSELSTANMRTNAIKGKLVENQALLRRLKNGQDNVLRRYGDFVIKIREEIDRASEAGRFRFKPVGPLGYYLKLRLPDIAGPLESHLGRTAHAFICDNYQDMSTLSTLFKKLSNGHHDFKQPIILCRKFTHRHNVTRFKAKHDTYKTLLDYLDIEDDNVFNAVVDRNSLESVLFIPDYGEAENLMLTPALIPEHTRCAYTKDCSVMYPKTSSGGYKSFANSTKGFHLFSSCNAAQVREREREIDNLNQDLRDAEQIVKNLQDSLNVQRSEYDRNNQEIKRIIDDVRKKEEQLLILKTAVTVEPQELLALETELDTIVKNVATEQLIVAADTENLVSLERNLADISKEKEECANILKRRETERQGIHKIVEQTKANINEFQTEIKALSMKISRLEQEKSEESQKLDVALERSARSRRAIHDDWDKPTTIRATNIIKEEVRKVEVQLRVEAEDRDPEELMESLKRRMAEIENLTSLKDSNLSNFSIAARSLNSRSDGIARLRNNTFGGVSTTFSTVMRTMKMNGELKIYLNDVIQNGEVVKKAKTLEMRIDTNYTPSQRANLVMSDTNNNSNSQRSRLSRSQPDSATPTRAKRARIDSSDRSSRATTNEKENEVKMSDARSLSGGERSFSTVAFVLALWHHCVSPFKLMDEIDVFMDMVTRRISYNALIRFAELSEDPGQFIFFSPLELPKFDNSGNFVRVFEMPTIVRKRPYSQIECGGDEAPTQSAAH